MSATGILILIIAVWVILNSDKLAWVFLGQLQLNTTGFQTDTHLPTNPPKHEINTTQLGAHGGVNGIGNQG